MKTYTYFYENLTPLKTLTSLCCKDDILYFDIETKGLSKEKNHIYLIGCGYYSNDGLNIIQWFSENDNDEINVLNAFLKFSLSFTTLVNYNGKSFDIPFIAKRLSLYSLCMPDFVSIDIFTLIKPLKKLLSLSDFTQKSIEAFLKIKRTDKYNGGELIDVYKNYVNQPSDTSLNKLLLHNLEDVLNMHYIAEILEYTSLLKACISYENHYINEYNDYFGNTKKELIIEASHDALSFRENIHSFYTDLTDSFLMNFNNDKKISIRIPINHLELKYFIKDYKNYCYLINEDMCVYKEVASFVSKENKKAATKENCYVKLSSDFIPLKGTKYTEDIKSSICDDFNIKIFKDDYKSKNIFISLSDFENATNEEKNYITTSIVRSFMY